MSKPSARAPKVQRPERSQEEKMVYLRKSLKSQLVDGATTNALKTTDKILRIDEGSVSARLTKLSILIHTGRLPAALALLAAFPADLAARARLERAYCLSKDPASVEEAKELVKELLEGGGDKPGPVALDAQLAYAESDFATASSQLSSLLSSLPSSHPARGPLSAASTLASAHALFSSTSHLEHLPVTDSADLDDLEELVPSLPPLAPVASSSNLLGASAPAPAPAPKSKRRHPLPKSAVGKDGQPFTEDPERWLPLRQRTAPPAGVSTGGNKRSGPKKEATGFGAQGAAAPASAPAASTSSGGGGGGKKKKGKK